MNGFLNSVKIEKELGIKYLERAVDTFQDILNKQITAGHILHIAAEEKNKDLANKYLTLYFNNIYPGLDNVDNLIDEFICKNDNKWEEQLDYTLLTLFKLINSFNIKKINEGNIELFIKNIQDIIKQISSRKNISYPVNLIMKYIALIIYKLNDDNTNEDVLQLLELAVSLSDSFRINLNSQLNVIMIISYQIKWLEYDLCSKKDEKKHCLINLSNIAVI